MRYSYGATQEEARESVRKLAERASGLEQQAVALRAEVMRLDVQQKRLRDDIERLVRRKSLLKGQVKEATERLDELNDAIGGATVESAAVSAERNRNLWAERYEAGIA